MKKCPYCAEEIQEEAIICKHCGRDLTNKHPEVIAQDRAYLTRKLVDLEKDLASLGRYLEEQGQFANQAGRQVTGAYVGIIVGLFLIPAFGLGLLLVAAGILAAVTQSGKRTTAENNQAKARQNIEVARRKIVDVRAMLAGL